GTPRIHTWSLAVEEHFYLVLALMFFCLVASRRTSAWLRMLPVFVVVTVVVLAMVRRFVYLRDGPEHMNLYATHLRFDGLLIGTLLAYWTHFSPDKLARFTRYPISLMVGGAL